jgi:hypothetical protein
VSPFGCSLNLLSTSATISTFFRKAFTESKSNLVFDSELDGKSCLDTDIRAQTGMRSDASGQAPSPGAVRFPVGG